MTTPEHDLLTAVELHSVEQIRRVLDDGVDLQTPLRGKLPIQWLMEMYTRSDRFPACVRLFLERGARLEDPRLAPVLLDDADGVTAAIGADRSLLTHRTTLASAFTPLAGASLLHVAAEYGNAGAARALIALGADVNARAAEDEHGLNGQTPLFHTVNSNGNRSEPLMRLLLDSGARADIRLAGITWGKGFEWETTLLDVTPISYAQFGLLPQMHREERHVAANVERLLAAAGRGGTPLANVPNRYLQPRRAS
jgi:ankyrin repeat protein